MVEPGDCGTGHDCESRARWGGGVVDDWLEDGFVGHVASTAAYASAIENQDSAVWEKNTIRHCLRAVW